MAAPTFRSEDEEARFCLAVLRDGSGDEKIEARDRLASIFARRGLFGEAAELYELNARAGVRSPELFERLSETYRQIGDSASADAALTEARRLQATRSSGADSLSVAQGTAIAPPIPRPPTPSPSTDSPSRSPSETSRLIQFPAPPTERQVPRPPSPPDRRQSHQRSVAAPLLVAGGVLCLIVLPAILLAVLVINPLGLYLEGRAAGPTVDASSGEPVRLKIAPHMQADWYLQTGRSVSGLWATPGLELTLDQDVGASDGSFVVTAPRPQSWGETITIVERRGQGRANQATNIPATFVPAPGLPPTGTVLDGRITGQVTAPRLAEAGQFNTSTDSVEIPVQLVVVSQLDLWLDRFVNAFWMLFDEDRWLLIAIGSLLTWCVLAGGAAVLFRVRRAS
jgi:hypothetical protein